MKPIFILSAIVLTALAVPEDITVQDFKIGFLAKDQEPKNEHLKSVALFSKHSQVLSADQTQRMYVNFKIAKKADNSKIVPQQVFIRLEHSSGEDAIIVVNPQSTNSYTLDSALRVLAKKLNNLSGSFKASLIIGGSNIKNAINWQFADLELNVPTTPEVVRKSQQINYDKLPEIKHQFRQPEKRPSVIISDAFTILCLVPFGALIVAWIKIGPNFNNVPGSIWVPVFHLGLAAMFVLYFAFWIELNMFETLKYIAIIGFMTFVAGNRVLRSLASGKQKSE